MRARLGVRLQQIAEDGVRDEVEHVSRNVPQDHGPSAPVQALQALGLQDAADAVDGTPVQSLAGDADRAQGDVGATRHVTRKVQVLCRKGLKCDSEVMQCFPLEYVRSLRLLLEKTGFLMF